MSTSRYGCTPRPVPQTAKDMTAALWSTVRLSSMLTQSASVLLPGADCLVITRPFMVPPVGPLLNLPPAPRPARSALPCRRSAEALPTHGAQPAAA